MPGTLQKEFLDIQSKRPGDLPIKISRPRIYSSSAKGLTKSPPPNAKIKLAERGKALDCLAPEPPRELQALRKDDDDCKRPSQNRSNPFAEVTKILQRVIAQPTSKRKTSASKRLQPWNAHDQAFAPNSRLDAHNATLPFRTALIEARASKSAESACPGNPDLAGKPEQQKAKARAPSRRILRFIEEARPATTALGRRKNAKALAHTLED